MSHKKEDCPVQEHVLEKVCDARMKSLDTKMKYLFGTSIITIALIIIQLVRGA